MTPPILRWIGGKRKLLPEILPRLPDDYDRWIEPFLGSASVLLAAEPAFALVGDACSPLVHLYREVAADPIGMHGAVQLMLSTHTEDRYYERRLRFNGHKVKFFPNTELATLMWYLNRTNFNGLYRENSSGEYNVSCGHVKYVNPQDVRWPFRIDRDQVLMFAHRFRQLKLCCGDWRWILGHAEWGDFVYLDPPYYKESETSSFGATGYNATRFDAVQHEALAQACHALHDRGVLFMLHNSDTPQVSELWDDFLVEEISRPGTVNASKEKRGRVSELIIRNYECAQDIQTSSSYSCTPTTARV